MIRAGRRRGPKGVVLITAVIACLLVCEPASAQAVIDQVMSQYQSAAAAWVGPLQTLALQLFWSLAIIQFCWAMGSLAFRGADLAEILAELVTQIMFIGIFFFLVQQSSTIANDIINSFRQAATQASGTAGTNPTQILEAGINMGQKIAALMGLTTPGPDVFYAIAAFVVVIIMAFVAAIAVMVNIEAYIIVSALVLFTGFGGSRWTKEYAMRALTYAISIGAKLFMLNLVVGIGSQIITQESTTFQGGNYDQVMVLVGTVLVLAAIAKQLPDMIASMTAGAALGASGGLIGVGRTAATTAAAVATAGITAGVGAGFAARAAGSLASQQVAAVGGAAKGGRLARFAALTGRTASNLGDAALSDIGGRLAGTRTNRGAMPFRMAADLRNRADSTEPPPLPPSGSPAPQRPPDNTIRPG